MKKIILIIAVLIIAGGLFYGVKSHAPTLSDGGSLYDPTISPSEAKIEQGEESVLQTKNDPEGSLGLEDEPEQYIDPGFEGIPLPEQGQDSDGGNDPVVEIDSEIRFIGILEEVDTSCFADGECYVVVDGKKVTLLIGWSRDTVGEVRGTDGIGGLEEYIGQEVEVYGMTTSDGNYTLYGKVDYYVEPVTPALVG